MSMPIVSGSALNARRRELSEAKTAERYLRFGPFQIDLQREELFKEGSRVRIPSKVFQVLLALVERPGEIVSRDALRARLWPGDTFGISTRSPNHVVLSWGSATPSSGKKSDIFSASVTASNH